MTTWGCDLDIFCIGVINGEAVVMKCVLLILDNSPITSITGLMETLSLANSLLNESSACI